METIGHYDFFRLPILPTLAQELRTHLNGRRAGYLFESSRHDLYSSRAVQLVVKEAARAAGLEQSVTPHRLRASMATLTLEQVQKFLRHKLIATTQIYAETSLRGMGENYVKALERRGEGEVQWTWRPVPRSLHQGRERHEASIASVALHHSISGCRGPGRYRAQIRMFRSASRWSTASAPSSCVRSRVKLLVTAGPSSAFK